MSKALNKAGNYYSVDGSPSSISPFRIMADVGRVSEDVKIYDIIPSGYNYKYGDHVICKAKFTFADDGNVKILPIGKTKNEVFDNNLVSYYIVYNMIVQEIKVSGANIVLSYDNATVLEFLKKYYDINGTIDDIEVLIVKSYNGGTEVIIEMELDWTREEKKVIPSSEYFGGPYYSQKFFLSEPLHIGMSQIAKTNNAPSYINVELKTSICSSKTPSVDGLRYIDVCLVTNKTIVLRIYHNIYSSKIYSEDNYIPISKNIGQRDISTINGSMTNFDPNGRASGSVPTCFKHSSLYRVYDSILGILIDPVNWYDHIDEYSLNKSKTYLVYISISGVITAHYLMYDLTASPKAWSLYPTTSHASTIIYYVSDNSNAYKYASNGTKTKIDTYRHYFSKTIDDNMNPTIDMSYYNSLKAFQKFFGPSYVDDLYDLESYLYRIIAKIKIPVYNLVYGTIEEQTVGLSYIKYYSFCNDLTAEYVNNSRDIPKEICYYGSYYFSGYWDFQPYGQSHLLTEIRSNRDTSCYSYGPGGRVYLNKRSSPIRGFVYAQQSDLSYYSLTGGDNVTVYQYQSNIFDNSTVKMYIRDTRITTILNDINVDDDLEGNIVSIDETTNSFSFLMNGVNKIGKNNDVIEHSRESKPACKEEHDGTYLRANYLIGYSVKTLIPRIKTVDIDSLYLENLSMGTSDISYYQEYGSDTIRYFSDNVSNKYSWTLYAGVTFDGTKNTFRVTTNAGYNATRKLYAIIFGRAYGVTSVDVISPGMYLVTLDDCVQAGYPLTTADTITYYVAELFSGNYIGYVEPVIHKGDTITYNFNATISTIALLDMKQTFYAIIGNSSISAPGKDSEIVLMVRDGSTDVWKAIDTDRGKRGTGQKEYNNRIHIWVYDYLNKSKSIRKSDLSYHGKYKDRIILSMDQAEIDKDNSRVFFMSKVTWGLEEK